jgi:lipopolysaccharide transport system ATP-binding protein
MSQAVRFDEVVKRYARGGPRYSSLRYDLASAGRRLRARLAGRGSEPRGTLALDRVSFRVEEGESYGIIGPNGAGKTTALKLIARISYPTAGAVGIRGRVGALIEVGSGVHPELTGRENIRLLGAILGMGRAEVRRRFDEIVDFAELKHVLDTPLKMYSSGMQLRLGFSIASHLEPDLFVVDEALAVGDASFQGKCVERMSQLVAKGHTLLFISHNLSAVEAICRRGLFLVEGRVQAQGDIRDVLRAYLEWVDGGEWSRRSTNGQIRGGGLTIEQVTLHGGDGEERYAFDSGECVEVRFHVRAEHRVRNPWFSLGISDGRPGTLVLCSMLEGRHTFDLRPGHQVVRCLVGPLPLAPRVYELWTSVREQVGAADLVDWSRVGAIRVKLPDSPGGPAGVTAPWLYGAVRVPYEWSLS